MVKAISGVQTVRFKNELERNITIKLGYANAKIYKCEDDACPRPSCYRAYGSTMPDAPNCEVPGFEDKKMKLVRHVSFVDCPGHDILMATMLNGAAVMDGALLLVAGNESCPQPQTSEHLAAVEMMRLLFRSWQVTDAVAIMRSPKVWPNYLSAVPPGHRMFLRRLFATSMWQNFQREQQGNNWIH